MGQRSELCESCNQVLLRGEFQFRLLVDNHKLGTAYSILEKIDTDKWATVDEEMMERMLDIAVSARDRKRVRERVNVKGRQRGCI